jgi:predicted AlkP superfamily phosphohydrolase/phosphomutase
VAVPTAPIDWARTRAYTSVVSTGEGVSLALRGREPEGTIAPEDYERARSELAAALEGFTDPGTGERPIRRAVPREQVLQGAYLDRAPDLLLEAAPRYSLTHARAMVERADWLSGDHRPEGVYVAAGPGAGPANGAEISLTDFAALISGAVGVEPDAAWSATAAEEEPAAVFSDREQREVEERLRGLGYLE